MILNNSNLFTGNDFLVYLISVVSRNFVVYIQTKNVKKMFCMLCLAAHIFYFKPAV